MRFVAGLALVFATVAHAGPRSPMPADLMPGSDEEKLIVTHATHDRSSATRENPFVGKNILAIAIVQKWTRSSTGIELIAAIAVFDTHNAKCWLWSRVHYTKAPRGNDITLFFAGATKETFEVPCAQVGYTVTAADRKRAKSLSKSDDDAAQAVAAAFDGLYHVCDADDGMESEAAADCPLFTGNAVLDTDTTYRHCSVKRGKVVDCTDMPATGNFVVYDSSNQVYRLCAIDFGTCKAMGRKVTGKVVVDNVFGQ
jgi:hypothetical protein